MHSPGLFRHLAIIVYDALLLLALLFLATAIVIPLNSGEAFNTTQYIFPIYLLLVSFVFYGWFWTHGGQTLGMKAWKVKVLTFDKKPLTWMHALKRFLTAILSWVLFGMGFFWQLFNSQKHTWHDYVSKTTLVFE